MKAQLLTASYLFWFSCGFRVLSNLVNTACLIFQMSQVSDDLQFEHEKGSKVKQLVKKKEEKGGFNLSHI